jgi:hypothetical protein
MKTEEVKVGGTYLAKVGARSVEVRIKGANGKGGWDAVSVASAKPIRVKDAKNLRPSKGGDAADSGPADDVEQPAPPDQGDLVPLTQIDKEKKSGGRKTRARAEKSAVKAPREKKAPKEKKPKALSALDAAAAVLKERGEPMRCVDMIAAMKERKLWETNAPTPQATLYSALLREITTKGTASRFRKADRGLFALNAK